MKGYFRHGVVAGRGSRPHELDKFSFDAPQIATASSLMRDM